MKNARKLATLSCLFTFTGFMAQAQEPLPTDVARKTADAAIFKLEPARCSRYRYSR